MTRLVKEFEGIAQSERVGELVVAHGPRIDHLRLRPKRAVHREQRVIDERFERYGTIPIAMLPIPTTLVVRSKVGTL